MPYSDDTSGIQLSAACALSAVALVLVQALLLIDTYLATACYHDS